MFDSFRNMEVLYSPKSTQIDQIMTLFSRLFQNVTGLKNVDTLEKYYRFNATGKTFAAVQFPDDYARKNISAMKTLTIAVR